MKTSFDTQLQQAQALLPRNLHDYLEVTYYGVTLNHPFCFLNAFEMQRRLNGADIIGSLDARGARFESYCDEGDWESALFVVERPYRAQFLHELILQHGVKDMFSAISAVWSDTETSFYERAYWRFIWGEVEAAKDLKQSCRLMTLDEQKFFAKLPSRLVIYRGFNIDGGEISWSWTLDRAKAEWFARRLAGDDAELRVATMKIKKSSALAYFAGRNEAEIVVNVQTARFDSAKIKTLPLELLSAA